MNPVYLRLALYILSTLLGMIPAAWAGWVAFDGDTMKLTVDIEAVAISLFAASGLSAGVFRLWGTK